jgi:predicted  nucleic acid-binding Zn-ribbon protein
MRDGNEKKNALTLRLDAAVNDLNLKNDEIAIKKKELEQIELETDKELETLTAQSESAKVNVEDRYLIAYDRIRKAYRNGLSVVTIDRDSCGGCFAKVPPQRQLEVKQRKKIIVCENCGRIFVYPKSKEVEDMNKEVEEVPKVVRSRSKRVRGE